MQSLVVRAEGDPLYLSPAIKEAIWSVDPALPITRIATMSELSSLSESRRTFALTVLGLFACAAVVLAALGLYGVVAGSVAERTREIGLRSALGATPGRVLAMVVRQGVLLTGVGVALGLLGAAASTQVLETLLFGVSPVDPATYAVVTGLLLTVAVLASWVPARRAAQVAPAVTLRVD
ncbi:MAG: FtsX-like permease family protein [Gammaproteobacteria bacterium]|nr:FtsX-like permease family protein [Gammaproteobacteria bacterium]